MSHFYHTKYLKHTELCVGAKVAIATVNFLPEVGLYNETIGESSLKFFNMTDQWDQTTNNITLPDNIVVDIPHLKLPSDIAPWDNLHKTVSTQYIHNANIIFHPILR
jgi:hypothetical protein